MMLVALAGLLKIRESCNEGAQSASHAHARTDQQQSHVFSYLSPEQRVRKDHPLRPIRMMVDEILKQPSHPVQQDVREVGRSSIPPEQLLRAQLLQMLYSVRRAATGGRDGLQHLSAGLWG